MRFKVTSDFKITEKNVFYNGYYQRHFSRTLNQKELYFVEKYSVTY